MKTKSSRYLPTAFALLFAAAFALLLTAAAPSRAYADTYTVVDSSTRDTLQQAIDDPSCTGIHVPAGEYDIDIPNSLTVNRDFTIQVDRGAYLNLNSSDSLDDGIIKVEGNSTLNFVGSTDGGIGNVDLWSGAYGIKLDPNASLNVDLGEGTLDIQRATNFGIACGDASSSGTGALTVRSGRLLVQNCATVEGNNGGGIFWNGSGGITAISSQPLNAAYNGRPDSDYGQIYMQSGDFVVGDSTNEGGATLQNAETGDGYNSRSLVMAGNSQTVTVNKDSTFKIELKGQNNEFEAIDMNGGTVNDYGTLNITAESSSSSATVFGIRGADTINVDNGADLQIEGTTYGISPADPAHPAGTFNAGSRSLVTIEGSTSDSAMATNIITGGSVDITDGTSIVNGQLQKNTDQVSGTVVNANGEALTRFDLAGNPLQYGTVKISADTTNSSSYPAYDYELGRIWRTPIPNSSAYVWAPATHVKFWDSKDRSGNLLGERTTIRGNTIGRVDGSTDAIEQGIKVAEGQKIVWHRCDNEEVWDPANTPVDADVDVYYTLEPPQPDQPSQPDQTKQPDNQSQQPTQPADQPTQPNNQPAAQPAETVQPEQEAPQQEIPETSDTVNLPFLVGMLLFGAAASGTAFYKMRKKY